MSREVVNFYENYREEDRFATKKARRIEFLTTVRKFDRFFQGNLNILDCAAGTGVYAFYFAEKGHSVTATDITPRHIEYMNERLKEKDYLMETRVLDATDMRFFSDEQFDVVLNMGPFYHLTNRAQRRKCLEESYRVLKKGGILATAYIPRLFINQMIALSGNSRYLDKELLEQIRDTGVLTSDHPKCFWTDTYYSSYDEMQSLYQKYNLVVLEHFAQDGLAPLFHEKVEQWSPEEFETWFRYHLSICSERAVIDMSNHAVILGRKQ